MFVVTDGHCSEVSDLVEEAFDGGAVAVPERAGGRDVLDVGHGSDVRPRSLSR